MTDTVSSGTLNSIIPYHTMLKLNSAVQLSIYAIQNKLLNITCLTFDRILSLFVYFFLHAADIIMMLLLNFLC